MSLDNRCSFIGRMAAPPEPLGPTGVKFRLGTDAWNGQTKQKETVWVPFVAWGKDADLLKQYGTVGRQIAIEAEYKPREYEAPGPNGGAPQKRLDPQFLVRSVKLLAESNRQQQQGFSAPAGAFANAPEPPPDPGYGW